MFDIGAVWGPLPSEFNNCMFFLLRHDGNLTRPLHHDRQERAHLRRHGGSHLLAGRHRLHQSQEDERRQKRHVRRCQNHAGGPGRWAPVDGVSGGRCCSMTFLFFTCTDPTVGVPRGDAQPARWPAALQKRCFPPGSAGASECFILNCSTLNSPFFFFF